MSPRWSARTSTATRGRCSCRPTATCGARRSTRRRRPREARRRRLPAVPAGRVPAQQRRPDVTRGAEPPRTRQRSVRSGRRPPAPVRAPGRRPPGPWWPSSPHRRSHPAAWTLPPRIFSATSGLAASASSTADWISESSRTTPDRGGHHLLGLALTGQHTLDDLAGQLVGQLAVVDELDHRGDLRRA